ncbi:hydroxysteroid dehydrogenase-like protein 2 [Elysia marginata]|uniref:Hydroxysteroid dehydrogenase-like protein 2 n=1 Tax=Elysia marginata TaxID=1093978 RepID=A0AAV4GVZ5_9GAST|nr:hydroxysteroid dehydrogenase-like protein 2 [Elysia marginata]
MTGKLKSALILGASRGIGKQIALTFAENGYKVCVAAKTTESTQKLPGTIYDVVKEIKDKGGKAFPICCDVRSEEDIFTAISKSIQLFGGIDVAVYNAGAILWKDVVETPLKSFDLMNQINARGAYCLVTKILPHMLDKKHGRIILVAPPIYNRFFKGKTPYSMTKVASTVLVHGLANELVGSGVSISALWPATVIKSHVTDLRNVPSSLMRKSTIFADACLGIAQEESESGDMDTDLGSALSADPRGCPLSPLVLIQPKCPLSPGPVKVAGGKRYKGLARPPSGGLLGK